MVPANFLRRTLTYLVLQTLPLQLIQLMILGKKATTEQAKHARQSHDITDNKHDIMGFTFKLIEDNKKFEYTRRIRLL